MVEYALSLDNIFSSLADATRRDILKHLTKKELSVSQIAKFYNISFAGVAKHLQVLEKARLIIKHRRGKEQIVQISPVALKTADDYLKHYETIWNQRFDNLEKLLKLEQPKSKKN